MAQLATTLEGVRRTLRWAIVVLSATNGEAWAQFTPEDFARIEWIGETAISPGGEQVAYTRWIPRRLDEPPGGPHRELWIISTAGGEPKQLVGAPWRASAPAWRRDGSDIAFLCRTESPRDDTSGLHRWAGRRRATPGYAAGHQRGGLRLLARREATRVHGA